MIVPSQSTTRTFRPNPIVSIEEYARYIDLSECNIYGITNSPDMNNYECDNLWTEDERNTLRHYLSEAQEEIEDEIGYFLNADWVVGDIANERDSLYRYIDQQSPKWNINSRGLGVYKSRWKKINEIGTRAESDISLGETINYITEPAVIGPIATTVTDINEIHVFHPGNSESEINPSEIIISGGFVTISIPRCRLKLESASNEIVDYTDDTKFEEEVDVKRIYTDSTIQAVLLCSECGSCENVTQQKCLKILNERQGTLEMNSSNLSCFCCNQPSRVGFNYYCGDINVTEKSKDVVVRLANAKMPHSLCGCDLAINLWERDRNIPEILTAERANCPFGISDGAWIAYQFTKAMKSISFGMI